MKPLLAMHGIAKHFGGIAALKGIDFAVAAGEVHVLLGENGAGKSTLIKVLTGAVTADAGSIAIAGETVTIATPRQGREQGIACIYQETSLCPDLSVLENLFLGDFLRTRFRLLDWPRMRGAAEQVLSELGVQLPLDARASGLGKAQAQLVEIARALRKDARIVIMDEPTAALTAEEVSRLFSVIARLKAKGVGIIYITHRLEEIGEVGDRVTVMRDGQIAGERSAREADAAWMIRAMVGRPLETVYPRNFRDAGAILLEVRGLANPPGLVEASFTVREGEIVGVAGLVGSGRSEIARAIFGIDRASAGEMRLDAQSLPSNPWSVLARGIAHVPEDRGKQGLLGSFRIDHNLSLSVLGRVSRNMVIDRRAEDACAAGFISQLDIRPPRPGMPARGLSGGNQQKVVMGRMLATTPRLLVLDEPTQGVDVGAKAEIHALIDRLVGQGAGILLISSDLPELLGVSDRILVMHQGRIAAELARGVSADDVMRAASGMEPHHVH